MQLRSIKYEGNGMERRNLNPSKKDNNNKKTTYKIESHINNQIINNSTVLELKLNNSTINNQNNIYNNNNNNQINSDPILFSPSSKTNLNKISGFDSKELKINNVINYNYVEEYKNDRIVIKNNNKQNSVQIEIKSIVRGEPFPSSAAYVVLFFNFFLPGIGTMIGTSYITDPKLKADYCCSGCFQLIMSIILIGWFLALCDSCFFLGASKSNMIFEDYYEKTKLMN